MWITLLLRLIEATGLFLSGFVASASAGNGWLVFLSASLAIVPLTVAEFVRYTRTTRTRQRALEEGLRRMMRLLDFSDSAYSVIYIRTWWGIHKRTGLATTARTLKPATRYVSKYDTLPKQRRRVRVGHGIVGKAFVDNGVRADHFADERELVDRSIGHYGMTEAEAMGQNRNKRALMCIPIHLGETCRGIIYNASTKREEFSLAKIDGEGDLRPIERPVDVLDIMIKMCHEIGDLVL